MQTKVLEGKTYRIHDFSGGTPRSAETIDRWVGGSSEKTR